MSELGDAYRDICDSNINKQEPKRIEYATEKLTKAGHTVEPGGYRELLIDGYVKFWPYTGWYSGKGIGSGRGIHTLLKKLKESK